MSQYNHQDLIALFNELFLISEQTELIGGHAEPLYVPRNEHQPLNQVIFRYDYYSSALHEIAHWCIASAERRKLLDYGYWYKPDGRTNAEQALFEKVEAKPQALEWIFSMGAGIPFKISADNLVGNQQISENFKTAIHQAAINYLQEGLPQRTQLFLTSLLKFYNRIEKFNISLFTLAYLSGDFSNSHQSLHHEVTKNNEGMKKVI